jgi:hypothetical protein
MIEYEYYDWTSLIDDRQSSAIINDIDGLIKQGKFWHNSPPYQTNVNVFGIANAHWTNLKMSFIWSCFAFMKQERQIKTVKSWGYKTNVETQEDRDKYWHQHIRENNLVLSGVYYLGIPKDTNLETSGTEFAPNGVEGDGKFFAEARIGNWIIFPGKSWHRPGILESKDWRYIVAADMEI